MSARKWIVLAALIVAAPLLHAESFSRTMTVSANVVASVRLTVDSQPANVNVTDADIARGYVDVAEPIVVRVQTNSRQGYLLQVANADDMFSAVELTFGDTAMHVAYESFLQRPYVRGGESIVMRARLRLSPRAEAGVRRVPIAMSASAL